MRDEGQCESDDDDDSDAAADDEDEEDEEMSFTHFFNPRSHGFACNRCGASLQFP